MAGWKDNAIMEWSFDGGTTWHRISDHGRGPLDVSNERIEKMQRMADGRLRRYTIAKKRSFTTSWENLPNVATDFLANGQTGEWMEDKHNTVDRSFHMRLRDGQDRDSTLTGLNGTIVQVMITDFSKEVVKRGPAFDLWNLDITLEEV